MTVDQYVSFAERYDLFNDKFGEHPADVIEFFKKLTADNQTSSVLDCACGTGNDIALFYELGLDVIGSDISTSMLKQAKLNLSRAGMDVELKTCDFRNLSEQFNRKFDMVVCLSSSIWHMHGDDDVVRAYSSMRSVLAGNGILVVTQGTSDKQWREKPRFILAKSTSGFSRLFVIDYHATGATYNVLDIIRGTGNPELKTWSIHYPHVLLMDDHQRLLEKSGFNKTEFYGSYSFDEYSKAGSNRLIVVAHNN